MRGNSYGPPASLIWCYVSCFYWNCNCNFIDYDVYKSTWNAVRNVADPKGDVDI